MMANRRQSLSNLRKEKEVDKENLVPAVDSAVVVKGGRRLSGIIRKSLDGPIKRRSSMEQPMKKQKAPRNKRISFGDVLTRTFDQADRTVDLAAIKIFEDDAANVSPKSQTSDTSEEAQEQGAVAPSLRDLLLSNEPTADEKAPEDEEEGNAVHPADTEEVTMEFTGSYSNVIQQFRKDQAPSDVEEVTEELTSDSTAMEMTMNHGSIINQVADLLEENEDEEEMEMTKAHGTILNVIQEPEAKKGVEKEQEEEQQEEVTMELTANYSNLVSVSTVEQEESMDLTKAHGSILVVTDKPAEEDEEVNMEETKNFSKILQQEENTEQQEEVTMELTSNHGQILAAFNDSVSAEQKSAMAAFLETDAEEPKAQTDVSEVTMEMTGNQSAIIIKEQEKESVNLGEETMDLTTAFGGILNQEEQPAEKDNLNESSNSANSEMGEMTMEMTSNFGQILSNNPVNISANVTEEINKTEGVTDMVAKNYADILAGTATDKTVDLPSRDKLSELTQDMAAIYEKILSGTDPNTADLAKLQSPAQSSDSSFSSGTSTPANSNQMEMTEDFTNPQRLSAIFGSAQKNLGSSSLFGSARKSFGSARKSLSARKLNNSVTTTPFGSATKGSASKFGSGTKYGSARKPVGSATKELNRMFNSARKSTPSFKNQIEEALPKEVDSLKTLLKASGLQHLDDEFSHMRPKRRDSSIGQVENSEDYSWPPENLEETLEAAAVDLVEQDNLGDGCLQLVDVTAEIKPTIASMEEWINTNRPSIFQEFSNKSEAELEASKTRMTNLFDCLREEAKISWNDWRIRIAEGTRDQLKENLTELTSDLSLVNQLGDQVAQLQNDTAARKNPEIIALRAEVNHNASELDSMEKQTENLQSQIKGTEKMLADTAQKGLELTETLLQAKDRQKFLSNLKENVQIQQDQFAVASRCAGWMLTNSTDGLMDFQFTGTCGTCVLTVHCDSNGTVITKPTISITSPTASDAMWGAHFKNVTESVLSLVSKVQHKSKIAEALREAAVLLRRFDGLTKEINTLQQNFTVLPSPTQGTDIRVYVTESNTQAVLTLQPSMQYPFGSMFGTVQINSIDGRDTMDLFARVNDAINHTTGFGKITKIANEVQRLLN
mmetsp:Transcript_50833/g.99652  ORF Transcript_50833/g.99652 Transcript_50833/m.99652 type:complete len:1118 (+) Transcript_50833:166-3519(+)|eukprot:CAMPEP_0175138460 /NCGR_PEP_ID=MMETSP0087-20121206/10364_1 /TAXON_ID=136419 /ORGANISM="Unknown Unknown, Strain D1" /LENGTH=1117 /DNA_ID=CAMNT_0016421371 /DNA_START=146 /DNA_END=3499 /DNA_ORIENTATION=+